MSVTLKKSQFRYKDSQTGNYVSIDAVAEKTTADYVSEINGAGQQTINSVNTTISEAQTSIDTLNSEKNTIAASVMSMVQSGTDKTLTTENAIADAKAAGDEIRDLKSALSNSFEENFDIVPIIEWMNGYKIRVNGDTAGSFVSDSSRRCAKIACNKGDKFIIHVTTNGSNAYRAWAFVDSSMNVLSRANVSSGSTNEIAEATVTGTAYLLINDANSGYQCYKGDKLFFEWVNDKLALKANQTQVDTFDGRITALGTSKADKTELVPIKNDITYIYANKADKTELVPIQNDIENLEDWKVQKPATNPNGTNGQLLQTNGDGTTIWVNASQPTDQQTANAVNAWLDNHPEVTTTVEDGSISNVKLTTALQNAIASKVIFHETVDDMIDDTTLAEGDVVFTKGFDTAGDGGSGIYFVMDNQTCDHIITHDLENGLFAVLQPENGEYNALAMGFKNDGLTDNHDKLAHFKDIPVSIYFPGGVYRFSPTMIQITDNTAPRGYSLRGDIRSYSIGESGGFIFNSEQMANEHIGTVFAPMGNQSYILKFGYCKNNVIEGISFTSTGIRETYANDLTDMDTLDCALYLESYDMGRIIDVNFLGIVGCGLFADNCWEVDLDHVQFRFITANITANESPLEHGALEFRSITQHGNNSAWNISNVNFERCVCHYIWCDCTRVMGVNISNFTSEENKIDNWYEYSNAVSLGNDSNSLGYLAFRSCREAEFSIGNMALDAFNAYSVKINNVTYRRNSVVVEKLNENYQTDNDSAFNISIGAVALSGTRNYGRWYYGSSASWGRQKSLSVGTYTADKDYIMHGFVGTLTNFYVPTIEFGDIFIFPTIRNPSIISNMTHWYVNLSSDAVVTDNVPYYTDNSRFFHQWKGTSNNWPRISILTPAWNDVNTQPTGDETCFSILDVIGANRLAITVKTGSNITMKMYRGILDNQTLLATATKKSYNSYDVYVIEDIQTIIAGASGSSGYIYVMMSSEQMEEIYNIIVS